MARIVSKLRESDKRKLVMRCIEKENEGWTCVRGIKHFYNGDVRHFNTESNGAHTFRGESVGRGYYEAIYEMK